MADDEFAKFEKEYNKIMGPSESSSKPLKDQEQAQLEEEEDFVDPREKNKEIFVTKEEDKKEQEEVEEKSEPAGDEDEYEPIPDNLVMAGKQYGFSNEEIVDLAENNPRYLERLAKAYEDVQSAKAQSVQPRQEFVQPKVEPEKKEIPKVDYLNVGDLSELDSQTKTLVDRLMTSDKQKTDMINQAMQKISDLDEHRVSAEEQEEINFSRNVDNYFDKIEDCPELGYSSTLNQNQTSLRQQLFGFAAVICETDSIKLEDALEKAVNMYKVSNHSENSAEAEVVKKINKAKTKFTARPGGQKSIKKYKDTEERVLDVMQDKINDMGIDF